MHAVWREAHFQVKMYKTHHSRTTFGRLWREAHFQVKMYKTHHVRTTCRKSARRCGAKHISKMWFCLAVARDSLGKVSKTWGFVAFPKTMASLGHLQRICKDAFRVAGAVQETCSSKMLGGQGVDFLRGVAFAKRTGTRPSALHSTFHF